MIHRWQALKRALNEYDVVHFNFGKSLVDFPQFGLHHLDFEPLRRHGKKIFMTYQGCDARLARRSLKHYPESVCRHCHRRRCLGPGDWIKKRRLQRVASYASRVFCLNPDLLDAFPSAELMLYAPANYDSLEPASFDVEKPFRILHAPSNPQIKGTAAVIRTVERLKGDGHDVELILVQNMPHQEALRLYRRCHVAVDQLYAGWYGVFAVELMAMGKPVLSYLRQEDLDRHVPFHDAIPVCRTEEQTLYGDLLNLLRNPLLRRQRGEAGRKYVEKFHNPKVIAEQAIAAYNAE
jgi:glycosyltransferase involved in cell wall biosynthesis